MVMWNILQNLSFSRGVKLLLEEGYIEKECIEIEDRSCDKLFLYPFSLKNSQDIEIDRIYFAEYCNQVIDDEYTDGRMTWEPVKTEWLCKYRNPPV